MKKSVLIMLALSTFSLAEAQIDQGAWLLGASSALGYNSYSYKNSPVSTQFNLAAKAGYFVSRNWVVGVDMNYRSENAYHSNFTQLGLAVFTRYYVPKNFFLGAGLGTQSTNYGPYTSGTTFPFEIGFAGFVTPFLALEPSIGYTIINDKTPYSNKSTFGTNLGLTIYLNRKTDK